MDRSATIELSRLGNTSGLCWATISGPGLAETTLEHRGTLDEIEAIALAYIRTCPERITHVSIRMEQPQ